MQIPGFYSQAVKGSLIGLKINGQFVSCETGCEFNFQRNLLAASAKEKGRWKEFVAGSRNWSMSVNGNLLMQSVGADIKTVLQALLDGEEVTVEFKTRSAVVPSLSISGTAIPQTGGIAGPSSGKASWNLTFQGTGPFETNFELFALIINAMPPEAEWPTIIDTTL